MSVTISGHSDDIISVDGDVNEEFYHYGDDPIHLAFSNGHIARVVYDQDGVWRITAVQGQFERFESAPVDDDVIYSDVATIAGDIEWVAYAPKVHRKK